MIATLASWAARAAAFTFPDVIGRLPISSNVIYLTFDDGPSNHTGQLLEILDDYGAHATFFLRGDRAVESQKAVARILNDRHGVGNHSFGHLDAWRSRWSDVMADLERGDEVIASLTGTSPRWVRPPFGRFRRQTLKWCRGRHRKLALWDVLAGDFLPDRAPQGVADEVVRLVRPGSLLVLHDGIEQQPHALEITRRTLRRLSDRGFAFDRLPESGLPSTS